MQMTQFVVVCRNFVVVGFVIRTTVMLAYLLQSGAGAGAGFEKYGGAEVARWSGRSRERGY